MYVCLNTDESVEIDLFRLFPKPLGNNFCYDGIVITEYLRNEYIYKSNKRRKTGSN